MSYEVKIQMTRMHTHTYAVCHIYQSSEFELI